MPTSGGSRSTTSASQNPIDPQSLNESNSGQNATGPSGYIFNGIDDLFIGAHRASPNGQSEAGKTYVVFGGAANLASLDGADGVVDGQIELSNLGAPFIQTSPWQFSYQSPSDILTFAHLAVDSYNGTGAQGNGDGGNRVSDVIRAPAGWTAILTTDDGLPGFGGAPSTPIRPDGSQVATYSTAGSGQVRSMQATAYREDATGQVVVGELLDTSIPLGQFRSI